MVSVVCLISYNRGGASARWHDHSRFTQCGGKKTGCVPVAPRKLNFVDAQLAPPDWHAACDFFLTVCEVLMTLLCGERESVCYRVVRECWRWKRSQILVQDLSFVAFHANIVPFHLWHWIQSEKVCVHQETCPFEPNSPFNLALKMKVSMWMPLFEMGNRWFHLVPANNIAVATQSFLDMRETVRSILVHVPSPVTIRSQTAGCILF
jgi:hypothetical protein